MKKLFGLIISVVLFTVFSAWAEEIATEEPEIINPEDYVVYGKQQVNVPQLKKMTPEEDVLDDDASLKPLQAKLSDAEKIKDNSANFDEPDKPHLPELLCSDKKLLKQVGKFIYDYVSAKERSTVPEQRAQVLLVKNMTPFTQIKETDLNKNFEASAALMYLKMNQNQEIYRICVSTNNTYKKFDNIYIILYPFLQYYKVVVANLLSNPENIDDATFIYNW